MAAAAEGVVDTVFVEVDVSSITTVKVFATATEIDPFDLSSHVASGRRS